MMAMRFLPLLERLGALSVTVVCEEPLERLFAAVCSTVRIVREHAPVNLAEFDLHVPRLVCHSRLQPGWTRYRELFHTPSCLSPYEKIGASAWSR